MSKKSKSSTTPWKSAQPYLLGAADNLQGAYNDNAGAIQDATNSVTSLLPSVIQKYQQGSPALNAAQSYNTDVLSGKYLDQQNPYLQSQIDQTNNDVTNSVQSSLGTRGLTGGSDYAKIIARELAKNESNLRYNDYSSERNAMATAAGQSPSIAAADTIQINPMLQLLGAYSTPLDAASQYASGVGGLFSPYSTTTQKQGLGTALIQGLSSAAGAYAASDPRLKTNVEYLGALDDGLNLYAFDYLDAPNAEIAAFMPEGRQVGVMVDEVAILRPDALGPFVGGYQTVNYGVL